MYWMDGSDASSLGMMLMLECTATKGVVETAARKMTTTLIRIRMGDGMWEGDFRFVSPSPRAPPPSLFSSPINLHPAINCRPIPIE